MPKRSAAELDGGRSAMRPCLQQNQQNLYLVLDDWEWGYSFRKVDLLSEHEESAADSDLPPAVFRLEARHALSGLFASLGTKILATHRTRRRDIPLFDVRSRALNFGPRHKTEPNAACAVYVEAAGKLFLLDETCFEALDPPPPPPSVDDYYHDDEPRLDWEWRDLPSPPFHDDHYVVAHAVHPDGRTLFFSTARDTTKRTKFATFSFDTARSAWARRGAWRLPFDDRGFYDRELDAWVGLCDDPDSPDTFGHLCVVVAPVDDGQQEPPSWKLSKERLCFCTDPDDEKHIGATLVYMGDGSRFCVVERLSMGKGKGNTLHLLLTTLSLKYDINGDLRAATYGRVRSYRLPEVATWYRDYVEKPVAFWM